MYETTNFSGVGTYDRLYLSVTRRTREERLAMFNSFEVAPPTCVQCDFAATRIFGGAAPQLTPSLLTLHTPSPPPLRAPSSPLQCSPLATLRLANPECSSITRPAGGGPLIVSYPTPRTTPNVRILGALSASPYPHPAPSLPRLFLTPLCPPSTPPRAHPPSRRKRRTAC